MTVGKIEKDGTVRDRSNMMIGKVYGSGKAQEEQTERGGLTGGKCPFCQLFAPFSRGKEIFNRQTAGLF
jgi:hypothetical protein